RQPMSYKLKGTVLPPSLVYRCCRRLEFRRYGSRFTDHGSRITKIVRQQVPHLHPRNPTPETRNRLCDLRRTSTATGVSPLRGLRQLRLGVVAAPTSNRQTSVREPDPDARMRSRRVRPASPRASWQQNQECFAFTQLISPPCSSTSTWRGESVCRAGIMRCFSTSQTSTAGPSCTCRRRFSTRSTLPASSVS